MFEVITGAIFCLRSVYKGCEQQNVSLVLQTKITKSKIRYFCYQDAYVCVTHFTQATIVLVLMSIEGVNTRILVMYV